MCGLTQPGHTSTKAMTSGLSDDDGSFDYREFTRVYGILINWGKLPIIDMASCCLLQEFNVQQAPAIIDP